MKIMVEYRHSITHY